MKHYVLVLCLFIASFTGCSNSDQQADQQSQSSYRQSNSAIQQKGAAGFQSISPQKAKELLDSRQDILLVDVRNPQELQTGSIENSYLVPFWAILRGQHNLPKDKTIMLVCAVGGRSYAAGQVLAKTGYKEVYNLSGGIDAWKKAGLPLVYKK